MHQKGMILGCLVSCGIAMGLGIKGLIDEFKDRRIEQKIHREHQRTRDHMTELYLDLIEHNNRLYDEALRKSEGG